MKTRVNPKNDVADNETLPEKPFRMEAVMVVAEEADPVGSVTEDGLALIAKSPGGGLGTMKVTFTE